MDKAVRLLENIWVSVHAHLLTVFKTDTQLIKWAVIVWAATVLIGIYLGSKERITVFRNFNDVFEVLFSVCAPLIVLFIVDWGGIDQSTMAFKIAKWIGFGIEAIVCVSILKNTWKDNKGFMSFGLALLTKMSLGTLLIVNLFLIFAGKSNRAKKSLGPVEIDSGLFQSIVMASMLAVAIFAVTRDKRWVKNVEKDEKDIVGDAKPGTPLHKFRTAIAEIEAGKR